MMGTGHWNCMFELWGIPARLQLPWQFNRLLVHVCKCLERDPEQLLVLKIG